MKNVLLAGVFVIGVLPLLAQQPAYTRKKFVQKMDPNEFKEVVPDKNGPSLSYLPINPEIFDVGILMDEVNVKNGELDGARKYYYPSGAPWIEYLYKDGKPWTIVANYDSRGRRRDPGTLKGGNGTIILYNEDGTPRETLAYKNGNQVE